MTRAEPDADAELLAAYLRDRSEPCPICGYDLRGLGTDRCPECGRALRLRIAEAQPIRGPFISGIIGMAAPAGAAATGLVNGVAMRADGTIDPPFFWHMTAINGTVALASALGLVLWLRLRPWLRRHDRAFQWGVSFVPWALTAIGYVVCLVAFF